MILVRIILAPLVLVYAILLLLRNLLYDFKLLGSVKFDLPVINVGNLAFGGTGKTPHIEYLIRLLSSKHKVAMLSRGYKRVTRGYVFANEQSDAEMIGDEPLQIKRKFADTIEVGVCEQRVIGVPNLLYDAPETDIVLLDDAFQHRAITAGLNILLTDYNNLFTRDYLAPAGTLREYRFAYKRAHAIVVTKCPQVLNSEEMKKLESEINPTENQKIFFSFQNFGDLKSVFGDETITQNEFKNHTFVLFSGIANATSFENYISSHFKNTITHIKFADHHHYTIEDAERILRFYDEEASDKKLIITTEKDAMRLEGDEFKTIFKNKNLFYLPLEIDFFDSSKNEFNTMIFDYVEANKRSN